MGIFYQGRHRVVQIYKGMSKKAKVGIVSTVLVAGIGGTALAASAATSYTPVTNPGGLSITMKVDAASGRTNPTGSVGVDAVGDAQLNAGTYQAELDVTLPTTAVPGTAPSFTATGGNTVWVIGLSNGHYVYGYNPGGSTFTWQSGENSTAPGSLIADALPAVNTWGTATGYQLALDTAGDASDILTVTSAKVVEYASNNAPTATLTSIQYDGVGYLPTTVQATPTPTQTAPAPGAPSVSNGHVLTVTNNRASVEWTESSAGWPDPSAKCEEVWISGYGFGSWNPADPANPGTSHVGYTCDRVGSDTNIGYLWGLAPGHTYALRIVPATTEDWGHRADATPLPGASVGYVDVFTTR